MPCPIEINSLLKNISLRLQGNSRLEWDNGQRHPFKHVELTADLCQDLNFILPVNWYFFFSNLWKCLRDQNKHFKIFFGGVHTWKVDNVVIMWSSSQKWQVQNYMTYVKLLSSAKHCARHSTAQFQRKEKRVYLGLITRTSWLLTVMMIPKQVIRKAVLGRLGLAAFKV